MDLSDKISALAQRIIKQKDAVLTEEATKNAFIMPFIAALGYDVFDPQQVIPEFIADVGVKKGEKVDYAIQLNQKVAFLIECKACACPLSSNHITQLYRYFSVTEASFAILTNGLSYWFYTDLDEKNKMDSKPFFEFDMLDYRASQIDELKKFTLSSFDIPSIMATASDLKYNSMFKREISSELDAPSSEFMRMLIARVHEGKLTANVLSRFEPLVQKALKDVLRELINQRLSSAIENDPLPALIASANNVDGSEDASEGDDADEGIVTTESEIEAYQVIRAILRDFVDVSRIHMRDAKSYCAIILDDNNRKPICRLHFNYSTKYIGILDKDKKETRHKIDSIDDMFSLADEFRSSAKLYMNISEQEG